MYFPEQTVHQLNLFIFFWKFLLKNCWAIIKFFFYILYFYRIPIHNQSCCCNLRSERSFVTKVWRLFFFQKSYFLISNVNYDLIICTDLIVNLHITFVGLIFHKHWNLKVFIFLSSAKGYTLINFEVVQKWRHGLGVRGYQWFFDYSTKAVVLKKHDVGRGGVSRLRDVVHGWPLYP
jgi:hypothetical protein